MPPLAAVPDLERELDALYALPLDEFTKARNDLATRLRKAHQSDAAAEVRGLRKPSVVAWAANQLARSEPELVQRLVEAGAELRDVQQRALAGQEDRGRVGDAASAEREAVRALVVAGRRLLADRATPALLDRLTQTLRAAAIDDRASTLLAAGRLTEDLKAIGFGPLEAVAPQRREDSDEVRRAAREHVNALRAEARRLAGEAREADEAVLTAERELEELRAAAAERHEQAGRAATELAAAEEDLRSRR